ncbi:MAG: choice-of-anchor J domain-containing protein [Prevotella sp.]|nr:choice-of-anchor J domain-containing protein [Prevotella sp.]MCM1075465.1 choice-of-anchor J domain-containing protein [Ruminococcus sp.]
MNHKLKTLVALLLPSMAFASGNDIEQMKANAQFLADHPVVAKIAQRQPVGNVPIRKTGNPAASRWSTQKYGPEHAALPEVWGNVVGADTWTGRYTAFGTYNFGPAENFALNLMHTGTSESMNGNGGAVKIGNKYHLTYWYMGMGSIISKYYVWNTDTWEIEKQKNTNNGGLCATDLAYDRLNNICYGAFFTDNQDGWELATIDFSGDIPVKTLIGRIPLMVAALGVNKAGEIYGICEDGVLYKFDKQTAAYTRIGDTGIKVAGYGGVVQQSGEFDQHSDIFYWAAADAYGRSTLYTVNTATAEVTKISEIPDRAQILNMQIMAPKAEDKAPGFINDLKADFSNGSLSGDVSFTVPSYTYDGDDLTSVTYYITANNKELASSRTAAGSEVNAKINVEAGDCNLAVWVENAVGISPISTLNFWAGADVPVMKEVTYTKNGNNSEISWSVNETGAHGGWVGDLSYKVVRMPDNYVVAEKITATSCTDAIPENAPLELYTYKVTPYNSDIAGDAMESNGNVVGSAVRPPYSNSFNEGPSSFDLMEILNNNKDKYTWHWETDTYDSDNGVAKANTGDSYADSDFDDWMLTPEISVEAGKSYEVSFRARCTEYYNAMNLEVKYGSGTDVSKYRELVPLTNMAYKSSFQNYKVTISSDKDENIRIGFHCQADYASGSLVIDDIRLAEGVLATAPGAVTNLTIVPDAKGNLKADVKFNAPTVDHSGQPLSSLTRIDIYCDNKLVKFVTNPTPGAEIKETVPVTLDGTHEFRVETFNEDGAGDEATISEFVGVDVPGSFSAWIEENGTDIIIKWNAPSIGANGRYINPDDMAYNIYSTDGMMVGDLLVEEVTGTSYSFEPAIGIDEGEQGMIMFAMRAVNRAGESRGVSTSPLIVGKPYSLPYEEHFDGSSPYYYDGDTDIYFNVAQGASSDDDDNCFLWYISGNMADAYKELRTLKLDTYGCANPRLTFDYKLTEGGKQEVYAIKPDGSRTLIETLSNQSVDGSWSSANIDLSQFSDERYLRIAVRFIPGDEVYGVLYLDNIMIQDAVDKDMAIEVAVPSTPVRYGQFASISAKVANKGMQTADEYTVTVYANGEKVGEQTGKGLEFMKSAGHLFQYEISQGAPEKIEIKAELTYAGDLNAANNTANADIRVGMPKVAAPENLMLNTGNENVLTWSEPSEFYSEEVKENFESYTPWTITNMGEWKLVDGDGGKVISLGDADYPNEGDPQAFTIFNPTSIGVPEGNTEANPHSGVQYAVCFATKVSPSMERNDDWMISPLLSGDAQTVSFYAKQMIPDYGAEKIEVLASSTGREIADFTKVADYEISNYTAWKKFETELPEGSLYFAIRVVTRDGHMFMLDDIEYIAGSCKEIVAWNVYRDSKFLAEVPYENRTYTDTDNSGNHSYNVTAVYATGEESAFSNTALTSGIDSIEDADKTYDIYSIDGRIISLDSKSIRGLEPGIYIINGEKKIIK